MCFNKNLHHFLLGLAACVGWLASTPTALASTINDSSLNNGTTIHPMQAGGGGSGGGGSSGSSSGGSGSGGSSGGSGGAAGGGTSGAGSAGTGGTAGSGTGAGAGTGTGTSGTGTTGTGTGTTGTGTPGTGTTTGTTGAGSSNQLQITVKSSVPTQNDYFVYSNGSSGSSAAGSTAGAGTGTATSGTGTGATTGAATGTSGAGTSGMGTGGAGTAGTGTGTTTGSGSGTSGTGTGTTTGAGTGTTTGTGTSGNAAGTGANGQMNAIRIGSISSNQTISQPLTTSVSSGVGTLIGMASGSGSSTSAASSSSSTSGAGTANDLVLAIRTGANTGQSWSGWFGSTSESSIVSDLQTNNTTGLDQFLRQYSSDFIPLNGGTAAGDLIEFGATGPGNMIGTVSFNTRSGMSGVPEPSTYGLLIAGAIGLGALKMRRKSSQS